MRKKKKKRLKNMTLSANAEEPYAVYLFRRTGVLSKAETYDIVNATN